MLRIAGFPEWVASSRDEYVSIAVRAASDVPGLQALRESVREQLVRSPLFDYAGVTRELEEAYAAMWKAHLARA